jgi:alpha-pyrone synthase
MEAAITAIGTANPIYRQNQNTVVEIVAALLNLNPTKKKLLKSLYKFTGIKFRHSVLSDMCELPEGSFKLYSAGPEVPFPSTATRMAIYKKEALPLAMSAIADCLSKLNNFYKEEITHLITVSCTGMYAPGIDIEIVQQLGLRPDTKRTNITFMGCYAAFNGIKAANAICLAEPEAAVLVVCVEICSIHFQNKTDLDSLTSNAIFADGASCALIQRKHKQRKSFKLAAFHCDLLPQSTQEMAWHIGDTGFDMVLTSYVPQAISTGIKAFLQKLTQKLQLSPSDIDYYAIHPGAKKILKACEKVLNISEEQNKYSYNILENFGNMSSATILFVLKLLWEDINCVQQHDKKIFSCAFGPGLTLESMILKTHYVQ